MIQAFRILCRCRGTKVQTRLMALGSIFCMLYFLVVTFTVTALAWFEILPNLYPHKPDSITSHKIVISFVFMNAMGNCVLILGTDTSIHRLSKELKKKVLKTKEFKNCAACHEAVPARTHHCYLCEACVLKRDHHCFFMTVCIGYFNHRYFVMFCFYMMVGTFYGMFLIVMYLKLLFNTTFYGPQTFITIIYDLVYGVLTEHYPNEKFLFLVILMYCSLTAGMIAASLWFWHLLLVISGQTTHEARRGIARHTGKSYYRNFVDIFGKYWILSVFVPAPLPMYYDPLFEDYQKRNNKKEHGECKHD